MLKKRTKRKIEIIYGQVGLIFLTNLQFCAFLHAEDLGTVKDLDIYDGKPRVLVNIGSQDIFGLYAKFGGSNYVKYQSCLDELLEDAGQHARR